MPFDTVVFLKHILFVFVMRQTCTGASDAIVFDSIRRERKSIPPKDELKMEPPYMMANTVVSNYSSFLKRRNLLRLNCLTHHTHDQGHNSFTEAYIFPDAMRCCVAGARGSIRSTALHAPRPATSTSPLQP